MDIWEPGEVENLIGMLLSADERNILLALELMKNRDNKEINEAIFSQPYIKPNVLGEIIGKTSRTTLTKYINELVYYKILRPKKDGVEVFYINDDLLRILKGE